MVAATLCGIKTVAELKRSGLRHGPQVDVESKVGRAAAEEFWSRSIRCSAGVRAKLGGDYLTSIIWPAFFLPSGLRRWVCARESRSLWAPSTRIGTPSAPTSAKAT